MLQDKSFAVETEVSDLSQILSHPSLAPTTLRRIAVMGNFPPRQCGLATFTRDIYKCLHKALPQARCDVIAMDDRAEAYEYPPEVTKHIAQDDVAAYRKLADDLNAADTQVLFLQHEFGIYGGPAGAHLLECLDRVTMPVVTTLHTVLENPNDEQRRVMEALIRRSSTLITMAHKGADILKRVYDVPSEQIEVVLHGAPERPLVDSSLFKGPLNVEGRQTLSTFGLLSPNKGIETVIEALPEISRRCPDVIYMVVGATHPNLIAHEGEAYRDRLKQMAADLGVDAHITFINKYLSDDDLIDILQATDVYVTPYLTETQITSGTLSYALAVGKPVVSAPYWHAVEALADGVGVVCPFRDSDAFAKAIIGLLTDDEARAAMSARAYHYALPSRWSAVAASYIRRAEADLDHPVTAAAVKAFALCPAPSWRAVERLSDDCGMAQHGRYRLPDRAHGYCADDNARALMLMARQSKLTALDERKVDMAYRYAAFMNHAWQGERFRNFMSFSRQWLDEGGSDDCCARSFEALIEVVRSNLPADLKLWAKELAQRVLPHVMEWTSNRSRAVLLRALDGALGHVGDAAGLTALIARIAAQLHGAYRDWSSADGHSWFETALSYDNARLPEGLLIAGVRLNDAAMTTDALSALTWLMDRQTASGHLRPIPTQWFDTNPDTPAQTHPLFDQQALEAQATLEACLTAARLTGDAKWTAEAHKAYGWFLGQNDHGLSLITDDGGCYDGLTPHGVNENQGAESVLAWHLGWSALKAAN
ncbi:glycosyltransferase family 4 protein [Asticcacaulis sp. BYS171W]|uniref:Glycosyltransferase family 4 protein n=1 Tax=Asticcacaulis aquaticus TaxID=2984212 RepID=A0ABT5HTC0_9CAUL|nr:glycosyltransferase family 4 protein [Asticcacaulis aquaticus]MDC7683213.1 glycosyltransferase family 4 protein [Asticcacaulis aquaticus]